DFYFQTFLLFVRSSRTGTFEFNSITCRSRSPRHRAPRAPRRADRARPRPPATFTHSAALDTRGALAIYLRPEKSWFKFPIHINWECLWIVTSKVLTAHVTAVLFVFMSG